MQLLIQTCFEIFNWKAWPIFQYKLKNCNRNYTAQNRCKDTTDRNCVLVILPELAIACLSFSTFEIWFTHAASRKTIGQRRFQTCTYIPLRIPQDNERSLEKCDTETDIRLRINRARLSISSRFKCLDMVDIQWGWLSSC